jgi:pilus assembly protein CpaE
MYPLPVILVGVDEDDLPDLERELFQNEAVTHRSFTGAEQALYSLWSVALNKEKRLVIIQGRSEADCRSIKRLSDQLPGWPILALVSEGEDPELLLKLYRAGAAQVVALPINSLELHEALTHLGRQYGADCKERRVIAVSGSVGGCGSTLIALNLADALASQLKKTTILAEMNLRMGALASYLDLQARGTLLDLLRDVDRVDDYLLKQLLVRFDEQFSILLGAGQVHSISAPPPSHLMKIVECLRLLSEVVVLDLPCTFHDLEFEVLSSADQVILVGLQTVPSVRHLKLIRDTLAPELVSHSLSVVLNRYDPTLPGFGANDIKRLLDVTRLSTIASDYQGITRSINQGKVLRQVSKKSPVLRDMDTLAQSVLGLSDSNGQTHKWAKLSNILKSWRG